MIVQLESVASITYGISVKTYSDEAAIFENDFTRNAVRYATLTHPTFANLFSIS